MEELCGCGGMAAFGQFLPLYEHQMHLKYGTSFGIGKSIDSVEPAPDEDHKRLCSRSDFKGRITDQDQFRNNSLIPE
jgi:hypothetical protein